MGSCLSKPKPEVKYAPAAAAAPAPVSQPITETSALCQLSPRYYMEDQACPEPITAPPEPQQRKPEPRLATAGFAKPCPPYAAKSVVGQRFAMEDSWQAVPDLLLLPFGWAKDCKVDQLPGPLPQPDTQGQGTEADASASDQGSVARVLAPDGHGQQGQMHGLVQGVAVPARLESGVDGSVGSVGSIASMNSSAATLCPTIPVHFFAVYDGHGGAEVAKHCAKNLHEHLKQVVHSSKEASQPPNTSAHQVPISEYPSDRAQLTPSITPGTSTSEQPASVQAALEAALSMPPPNDPASPEASAQGMSEETRDGDAPGAGVGPGTSARPSGQGAEIGSAAGPADVVNTPDASAAAADSAAANEASAAVAAAESAAPISFTSGVQSPETIRSIEAALKLAFIQVDAELAQSRTAHEVGSTAVVALLGATHLWVANCGDSRALLCREGGAVPLSWDHKATRMDEVSRVEKAGGYVWWDRVMGELAVSRAIGDHCLRPFVIAEPEVAYVRRRVEDQLLVLASDGLWDVFSNEEACKHALDKFRGELKKSGSSKQAVKKAASSLAKGALSRGSRDNITVIIVDIRIAPRPGASGGRRTTARVVASSKVQHGCANQGSLPSASPLAQSSQHAAGHATGAAPPHANGKQQPGSGLSEISTVPLRRVSASGKPPPAT